MVILSKRVHPSQFWFNFGSVLPDESAFERHGFVIVLAGVRRALPPLCMGKRGSGRGRGRGRGHAAEGEAQALAAAEGEAAGDAAEASVDAEAPPPKRRRRPRLPSVAASVAKNSPRWARLTLPSGVAGANPGSGPRRGVCFY